MTLDRPRLIGSASQSVLSHVPQTVRLLFFKKDQTVESRCSGCASWTADGGIFEIQVLNTAWGLEPVSMDSRDLCASACLRKQLTDVLILFAYSNSSEIFSISYSLHPGRGLSWQICCEKARITDENWPKVCFNLNNLTKFHKTLHTAPGSYWRLLICLNKLVFF